MLSFSNLLWRLCLFITPSSLETLNQRYFLHFKQRHCWGFCPGTCCSRADFCPRSSSWWRWLSPTAASWTFPWRPSLASRWSAHRDTCPGRAAGTERDDTGHFRYECIMYTVQCHKPMIKAISYDRIQLTILTACQLAPSLLNRGSHDLISAPRLDPVTHQFPPSTSSKTYHMSHIISRILIINYTSWPYVLLQEKIPAYFYSWLLNSTMLSSILFFSSRVKSVRSKSKCESKEFTLSISCSPSISGFL